MTSVLTVNVKVTRTSGSFDTPKFEKNSKILEVDIAHAVARFSMGGSFFSLFSAAGEKMLVS